MKSLALITADAAHVTIEQAFHEAQREINVRIGDDKKPGCYVRWANAEPTNFTKIRAYEAQTARLIAISQVLSVMTETEWHKLKHRHAELQRQLNAQQTLF